MLALIWTPKAAGPHPAVRLLHDHGAKFDIGKEKMIEPWEVPAEKRNSARQWVEQYYGGRFLGDELVGSAGDAALRRTARIQRGHARRGFQLAGPAAER